MHSSALTFIGLFEIKDWLALSDALVSRLVKVKEIVGKKRTMQFWTDRQPCLMFMLPPVDAQSGVHYSNCLHS